MTSYPADTSLQPQPYVPPALSRPNENPFDPVSYGITVADPKWRQWLLNAGADLTLEVVGHGNRNWGIELHRHFVYAFVQAFGDSGQGVVFINSWLAHFASRYPTETKITDAANNWMTAASTGVPGVTDSSATTGVPGSTGTHSSDMPDVVSSIIRGYPVGPTPEELESKYDEPSENHRRRSRVELNSHRGRKHKRDKQEPARRFRNSKRERDWTYVSESYSKRKALDSLVHRIHNDLSILDRAVHRTPVKSTSFKRQPPGIKKVRADLRSAFLANRRERQSIATSARDLGRVWSYLPPRNGYFTGRRRYRRGRRRKKKSGWLSKGTVRIRGKPYNFRKGTSFKRNIKRRFK